MTGPAQTRETASALEALSTGGLVEEAVREDCPPPTRRRLVAELRRRDEEQAQVAAALLCFDLARSGDPIARMELGVLRMSLADLAARPEAVGPAILDSPHLAELWAAVQAYLEREDPRDIAPAFAWPSSVSGPPPSGLKGARSGAASAPARPGAAPVPAARAGVAPAPPGAAPGPSARSGAAPAPASPGAAPAPARPGAAPAPAPPGAAPARPRPPPIPAAAFSDAPAASPVVRGTPLPAEPPRDPLPVPQASDFSDDFEDDIADDLFDLGDTGRAAERRAAELRRMLRAHLGHDLATGRLNLGLGLATSTAEELDRLETFLREVSGRAKLVPQARGLASLGHLFFAVHLRRQTALGQVNPRWRVAVGAGLAGFKDDLDSLATAAALFGSEGRRAQEGFHKVLELLVDFLGHCHAQGLDPTALESVDSYVGECRLPPKVLADDPDQRRR